MSDLTKAKAVILLLDDDHDFVQMNQAVLRAAGYEVVCTYDPAEAAKVLAGRSVDLIITDLMMTSLHSGFEFARSVKDSPRLGHIPIIIATSVSRQMGLDFHPRSSQDLSAMGVDAYFDKPLKSGDLLAKVEQLLNKATGARP